VSLPQENAMTFEELETPDNWAGRMTKELMAAWLAKVKAVGEPSPGVRVYNAAWSAAYDVFVGIARAQRSAVTSQERSRRPHV
jgi:hypothetical protein